MNVMFAKSKQIGFVSLFLVFAATVGGCAESIADAPASFPSQRRPVAFLVRTTPAIQVREQAFHSYRVAGGAPRSEITRTSSAKRR
jgi:hypothetical protein